MSTSVRCEFIPTLCLKLSAGSLLYTDLPVVIKLLMLSQFVKEDWFYFTFLQQLYVYYYL